MVSADKKDISFDTLDKIDEILRERYPEPEELIKFPLGEKLQKLDRMVWTNEMRCIELDSSEIVTLDDQEITKILRDKRKILKHESIINVFRKHITECIKGIRILTTGGPYKSFFKEDEYKVGNEPYKSFETSLTKFDDHSRKFLRVITLYHDIGKVIHRDKHPMLGKHLGR